MKIKTTSIIVLILIIFFGVFFNYKELNKLPGNIHSWAQFDRYALALKFKENNLNFFKPATFVYNHIYPGGLRVSSNTTVSAVDFPIHDYIPALIMKVTGSDSPFIFRLYILLYSIVGMFFFYKLAYLWTNHFFKALFVTLLAVTSPVFIYYQGGFLPTIPSLANAIIGLWFYSRFLHNERNKDFNFSLLFLTLAALSRTTFLIPLIAILGVEFIRVLRRDTAFKAKLFPVIISIAFILGYWLYNRYLRATYGSMFLANFLPAKDSEEAAKILTNASDHWLTHWFTWLHYVIFICIVILLVNLSICGKIGKWNKSKSIFGFFILVQFIGTFLFAYLLLKQFEAHDYYFLDSFYLPLLALFILILSFFPLPDTRKANVILTILLALITVVLFFLVSGTEKERRATGPWDRNTNTLLNYEGSREFMASLGVPEDAKIIVLDATSPNGPLVLMNRNGYPMKYSTRESLMDGLTWDYDYLVFENENFMPVVYSVYPDIVKHLKKIGDNGRISVCTYSDTAMNQSVEDLLSLADLVPIRKEMITFDSPSSELWKNINTTDKDAFSGSKSALITDKQEYGLTFQTSYMPEITQGARTLLISGRYKHEKELSKCYIVLSINVDGKTNVHYFIRDLKDFLKEKNKWEKAEIKLSIPKVTGKEYAISIYLWNVGKNNLLYDDIEVRLY